jgi:hypothetical protein
MTFNPQNRPGSFGKGDLASQAADAVVDERVDTLEGGGGGGLSTIQFSVSWSGGDGDFKVTAGFGTETFLLTPAVIASGLKGIVVATELHTVEGWVGIGTDVGFRINKSPTTPTGNWLQYVTTPGNEPVVVSAHTLGLQRGLVVGDLSASGGNFFSMFGATPVDSEYDPNVQMLTGGGAGPALNLASAGKTVFTLHYIPLPTSIP